VNVSKKTSAKIEQAIRETGYQPDEAARALRNGRFQTLGLVVPKVANTFFGQTVQMMEERARALGYSLMLFTHMDRADEQAKQLSTLRRCRVDGVILTAAPNTTADQIRRELGDTPVVAYDAAFSDDVDSVVLQNREAACEATEHLAAHGMQKIALVGAKPTIFSFAERIEGYSEAMKSRGLQPALILAEDYDELRYMLRNTLRIKERPEALLSLSDFATHNVIRIFEELHLAPKDWVPLVGFDDFAYAPLLGLPISVIQQPIEEMVRTALNLLMRRIQHPEAQSPPQVIRVPGELVRRRSCGCT